MSKLDSFYMYYRRYCKEIANKRIGSILTEVRLFEDGAGRVITHLYLPTNDHPFNKIEDEIIRFNSPSDGAKQLRTLVENAIQIIS